ncbi:MAG: hypothetical protein LC130_12195 [Bryobacterales bacterium]|nr:hypothetical protein [Bryobacterales bacterium]
MTRRSFLETELSILSAVALPAASFAAGSEWLRIARVFLIDAYEPPFAVKLEYDAEALAETMAVMHANTVRIATMGKYALIQGVRFSPHPELGRRDILTETIAACKTRGIRVVPYISTGHKLAWTMITRDYPEYAQRTKPGGGPSRSHMFVGEDHATVCWNTPYRQAYLDLVEHVVRDYDIDGIYFDTWRAGYFWPRPVVCYCDGCRNGFRKATALELPWHENYADYTPAELATINRYHAWYQDIIVGILREVRGIVKSHRDIPLIYNASNPDKLSREDPRILKAIDAFLYERGNSILERAEGISVARAIGLDVWPYVGEYNNWPRAIYNGFDFQQQIFTTAMFGGAPILALPWGYVNHAANRRFVAYPFGILKRNERELVGFRNYPYAAVLHGDRTPPGHEESGWWWRTNVRLSSLGAFAACTYGHVQVSSIHESLLDNIGRLRTYRVLYLADIPHITETRIANIKQFVREGGGLVVSFQSCLFDQDGHPQDRFSLEELVRAAPFEPHGELAETIANYRSMTGGPYDLYLADRARRSLDAVTPLWHFQPVKALDGGEVWMDIVTGDGLRPILPGVIVSRYGKGCVVYCASALESLFVQQNSSAVGRFLRSLVVKAASEPPPYEIEAPAALISNLTVKDNTLVLHLTNWTGNKLERAGANEYYLAPVENVRIRLNVPEDKRVRQVRLLLPAQFREDRKGSDLTVHIRRVEAYQALRVDLE